MLGFFVVSGFSQTAKFWSANYESRNSIVTDKSVARQSYPKDVKLFNLDFQPFQQILLAVAIKTVKNSTVISLPNADGNIEQFEVFEASNFESALQARFPEIRAFSGKGISDKYATLKLSISPQGVQTMVFRTEKDNEFMEPYSKDHTVYAVYRSHRNKGSLPWTCNTEDKKMAFELNAKITPLHLAQRSTGDLKTMRLAQSVTAEYSNYFGATGSAQVSLVLAAINNTLTRCNGVYEKDMALHLNLVSASTNVIYYNASTDPYDAAATGAGGTWNAQLQSTLTSVIGEANYDIGHLFGASGGGGNAGCIGCVCTNGSKGSGFTSPADGIPAGDNFDIDYVVHEVGHQLGGNHTFSMSNEGSGVNKEIGSGITIMGYAGITSQDVANHSLSIYHEATIAQIQTNLSAVTCPVTTSIAGTNTAPIVAALTNYTIPKSTPFALTGSATDANGDALTYCWEQNDNAGSTQTGASSVASVTKATGPNWITFSPTVSGTRYFPKLATILSGALISGPLTGGDAGANTEALSSVARTLNFRLTVRDNHPYTSTAPVSVGQTQFKDMVVTVSSASGPFTVSAPNTAVSYTGGSTQTITWAVATTTAAPVSCANVKISLSTDGGQTFPTVLAASTPNDGTEALTIPNTPGTTARIKIEAVGNIFFDISNANFTITAGSSCGSATGLALSSVTTNSADVSWTAVSGATSYAVDYKLNSSGTWTSFSTTQTVTTASFTGLASGSLYDWRVIATCASGAGAAAAAQFTTASPAVCNAPTGLTSSSITTSSATVSWTAASGAVSYAVDYKLNSSGTWTSFSIAQAGTSANLTGLATSSLYDWRVITNCSSGSSTAATAQFTTAALSCTSVPAHPSTIVGPAYVCGLTTATYTVTAVAGITYTWTLRPGMLSPTYNAAGNSVTVTIDQTVGATMNGNITVTASNACGTSTASIKLINLVPGIPASLTGPTQLCGLTTATYTCTNMGTVTYNWNWPAGMNGPATTTVPTATATMIGTANITGSITVTPQNACGTGGTKTKVVNSAPNALGVITGPTNICLGSFIPNGVSKTYSVVGIPGIISYVWTANTGGASFSPNGGPNDFSTLATLSGNYPTSAIITVKATNQCFVSSIKTITVSKSTAANCTARPLVARPIDMKQDVKEINLSSVNVYPNPSNGLFSVKFNANNNYQNMNLEILNLLGQKVYQTKITNSKSEINISSQQSGMYLMRLIDNTGKVLEIVKLIKE